MQYFYRNRIPFFPDICTATVTVYRKFQKCLLSYLTAKILWYNAQRYSISSYFCRSLGLSLQPEFESDSYLLTNHDFEMNLDSATGGTWESVSGEEFKLKNVIDMASPNGYQHLAVLPEAGGVKQDITARVQDLK